MNHNRACVFVMGMLIASMTLCGSEMARGFTPGFLSGGQKLEAESNAGKTVEITPGFLITEPKATSNSSERKPTKYGSPVLGKPMVSTGGTRVYFPYLPYCYSAYTAPLWRNDVPPILFFDGELDMALIWDRHWQRFRWEPIVPVRPNALTSARDRERDSRQEIEKDDAKETQGDIAGTAVGEVIEVKPNDPDPRIVVRIDKALRTYTVTPEAVVLRAAVNAKGTEVPLGDLRKGDLVTLRLNNASEVELVRAEYKRVVGKVEAMAAGTVLLDSGEAFRITADTDIVLPNNARGRPEDLHTGNILEAEISPISGNAEVVQMTALSGG